MELFTALLSSQAPSVAGAPRSTPSPAAGASATAAPTAPPVVSPEDARTAGATVALLALLIPAATGFVLWSPDGATDTWTRQVAVAPFDIALLVAGVIALRQPAQLKALLRSRAVLVLAALAAVAFGASFAANPSVLGVQYGLRLLLGLAVISLVATAWTDRTGRLAVLGSVTVAGVAQAVLAVVQSSRGAAFGIEMVDFAGPLYPFGSSFAGRGGFTHPYHLAVFLVVAQGAALLGLRNEPRLRWAWLGALTLLGAGIGVTYTRSGAIGQVGLLVALALGRRERRTLLAAAAAIAIGLGVGATAFGDGWVARSETTVGVGGQQADSNRSVRLQEARELFEGSPALGVGPGRYVDALAETERVEYLPAHNVIAHHAAELGALGGLAVVGLLGLLALRVLRGGAWTAAVVVPVVPFLLLDAYPYVFATGLAVSALWLGLARASLSDPLDGDAPASPVPSDAPAHAAS